MPKSIKAILESVEGLPADMTKELETSFTESVAEAVAAGVAELKESAIAEAKEAFETEKLDFKESVVKKIDAFMTAVIPQWMEANAQALDGGLKVQLAESLITNIMSTLAENDITNPQAQSVIESMEQRLQKQRDRANQATKKLLEAESKVVAYQRKEIVEAAGAELSEAQQDVLRTKMEAVNFTSEAEFKQLTESQATLIKAAQITENDKGEKDGKKTVTEGAKTPKGEAVVENHMSEEDIARQEFMEGLGL